MPNIPLCGFRCSVAMQVQHDLGQIWPPIGFVNKVLLIKTCSFIYILLTAALAAVAVLSTAVEPP